MSTNSPESGSPRQGRGGAVSQAACVAVCTRIYVVACARQKIKNSQWHCVSNGGRTEAQDSSSREVWGTSAASCGVRCLFVAFCHSNCSVCHKTFESIEFNWHAVYFKLYENDPLTLK